jgi:hypothetical protein
MWQQRQCEFIYFPGPLCVLCLHLLEQGIVQPQVDIPLPVSLLKYGRLICNGTLIDLPGSLYIPCLLL